MRRILMINCYTLALLFWLYLLWDLKIKFGKCQEKNRKIIMTDLRGKVQEWQVKLIMSIELYLPKASRYLSLLNTHLKLRLAKCWYQKYVFVEKWHKRYCFLATEWCTYSASEELPTLWDSETGKRSTPGGSEAGTGGGGGKGDVGSRVANKGTVLESGSLL